MPKLTLLVFAIFLPFTLNASDFSKYCDHQNPDIAHTAAQVSLSLKQECHQIDPSLVLNLELENLDIIDLTPISEFVGLENLNLSFNLISDITPLNNLVNLKKLDLSENLDIADITPLTSLHKLEWLNLNDNSISDLSPLETLNSLVFLSFMRNQVTDLRPLRKHQQLEYFFPFLNPIIMDEEYCPRGEGVAVAISTFCKNY